VADETLPQKIIGYYDSKGLIHMEMDFCDYIKGMRKINEL
jgi:hypothetical protein